MRLAAYGKVCWKINWKEIFGNHIINQIQPNYSETFQGLHYTQNTIQKAIKSVVLYVIRDWGEM